VGPLQPEFPLYLGRIIAAALGRASATSEKRSDAENKSSFGDLFPPPDVEIDSKRKGDFEGVGGKKGGGGGKGGGGATAAAGRKRADRQGIEHLSAISKKGETKASQGKVCTFQNHISSSHTDNILYI